MTTTQVAPPADPSGHIAAEIRAEMGRQQLSTRGLAARMGVTDVWLSRRIGSLRVPLTLPELYRIAGTLGVDAVRWLPHLDSNQKPADRSNDRQSTRHAGRRQPLAPIAA